MTAKIGTHEILTAAARAFAAGRFAEAADRCAEALAREPRQSDALHLMGLVASAQGDGERGADLIRQAIALAPARAEFHYNLADILAGLGLDTEAADAYRQAIRLNPDFADALINLGKLHRRAGRLKEAIETHRAAVAANPNAPLAHFNLAASLAGGGDRRAALPHYLRAVQLAPAFFAAHFDLGNTWMNLGEVENAVPCFRNAVALRQSHPEAWASLGTALIGDHDAAEAMACFAKAIALDPECARARLGLSKVQLAIGDLAAGWNNFEYRLSPAIHRPLSPQRAFPVPRWQGEPLTGKTLLVWREEGIGDEILFASCIPDAAAQAGTCIVECSPRLLPLFARSFPTCTVRVETTAEAIGGDIDFHCPVGSLPRFLRRRLEDFPKDHVYLRADPDRVQSWRTRLASLGPGLKVGILWRSLVSTAYRRHFYAPPDAWGDVFAVPDAVWVDLQYGGSDEERGAIEARHGVTLGHFLDLDLVNDVDGSSALLSALDVVVGPSTTYTALAAALGTPSLIVAISQVWDRLGQDRSPFFPAARFFTKPLEADWGPPLRAVADALRACDGKDGLPAH